MSNYRIGDEVYIHGIIDEIRKDTIIIKNEGGYFGTVSEEIMPSAQPETHEKRTGTHACDLISRAETIAKFEPWLKVEGYSDGELNMLKAVLYELTIMPPAQPELIEKASYVRGFEQGRTQGMIDAQERKK